MSSAREDGRAIRERVRVAAYALCSDSNDRLLLVRMSPTDPEPGSWTLPGGGLRFGEHPEAGVLRELEEETGILGEIVGLAGVDSRVYEPEMTASGDRVQAIRIVYHVRVTAVELRHEPDGSTDLAAWVGPEELAELPIVDLVEYALGLRAERTPRA